MALDATSSQMNRRHFLRNTAVAVGAAALSLGTSESSQAGDRLISNTDEDIAKYKALKERHIIQETVNGTVSIAAAYGATRVLGKATSPE